jgi:hypothetical protein
MMRNTPKMAPILSTLPMMAPTPDISSLLDRCRALGIRLWVHEGRLRFDAPRGALDEGLRARLAAREPDLVAALTPTTAEAAGADGQAAAVTDLVGSEPVGSAGVDAVPSAWPPRSPELAGWPVARRERWGRRAARLQDRGLGPWEAERLAFEEVRSGQGSGDPASAAPDYHPASSEKPAPPPVRWECLNPFCLAKAGWWLSVHGVVNCLSCRPPSLPGLVVAQGGPDDPLLVDAGKSNQAVRV